MKHDQHRSNQDQWSPREVVKRLDKYIVGQEAAKRSIGIASRNRWRRSQIKDPDMRKEITPTNILMIGPTGVGKTEIARRFAAITNAPFIKVEATRYTEVGYFGKDVESIVRDLLEDAIKLERGWVLETSQPLAEQAAEERLLDYLLPIHAMVSEQPLEPSLNHTVPVASAMPVDSEEVSKTREFLRKKLRSGELNDQEITIELEGKGLSVDIITPMIPGAEDIASQLESMLKGLNHVRGKRSRRLTVKQALKALREEEASKLVNEDEIRLSAIQNVQENGVVFIDELDKICKSEGRVSGGDVSREGVQRDLLPLVEGCVVSTKYGPIKTDHILFIASGAFHVSKPSDLIAELQGRFPIRVELQPLTADDFERILKETEYSLTEKYKALIATEGFSLIFSNEAIRRMAELAWAVNEKTENIGARRLYTVLERVLDEISFEASERPGESQILTAEDVDNYLSKLIENEGWSRYIL